MSFYVHSQPCCRLQIIIPPNFHRRLQSLHTPTPAQVATALLLLHLANLPYARIYAKKEGKRRRIWNHALEKSLFNAYELSTLGAPHRRTIYMASLEAHIDRLHAQLLSLGYWPIPFDELEPYRGLNSKTAKSMVSGLQHDVSHAKLKLLELERANKALRETLTGSGSSAHGEDQPRLLGLDIPSFSLNSGRH